jgi:TPR repeat protein
MSVRSAFHTSLLVSVLIAAPVFGESLYGGMELLSDRAKALTPQTLPETQRLSSAGDLDAKAVLGFACIIGSGGLAVDPAKALALFQDAGSHGHVFAQLMVAALNLDADVRKPDVPEAVRWLKLAAEQRNTEAYYMLGAIFRRGDVGVEADSIEAYKWARLASLETANEEKRKAFDLSVRFIARDLSVEQIAQGEALAQAWLVLHGAKTLPK